MLLYPLIRGVKAPKQNAGVLVAPNAVRYAVTTTLTTAGASLPPQPEPSPPDLAPGHRGPSITENETLTEPTRKHP